MKYQDAYDACEVNDRNWNAFRVAGEKYSRIQLRALPVLLGDTEYWEVWDETGWNGFQETEPEFTGKVYGTLEDAMRFIDFQIEEAEDNA